MFHGAQRPGRPAGRPEAPPRPPAGGWSGKSARGGFVGQSEYVVLAGRGAATVEMFWDGMPMPAIGGDSLYVDAARIYLTCLRRVDVEVLPASLRVYLVSERHETFEDRSLVRVMRRLRE